MKCASELDKKNTLFIRSLLNSTIPLNCGELKFKTTKLTEFLQK